MTKNHAWAAAPGAEPDSHAAALAHWLAQEGLPLPDDPRIIAADTQPQAREAPLPLPSGWWLLPAIVASVPIWVVILRAVF